MRSDTEAAPQIGRGLVLMTSRRPLQDFPSESRVWYGHTHLPANGAWLSLMIFWRMRLSDSFCSASGFTVGKAGSCIGAWADAEPANASSVTRQTRYFLNKLSANEFRCAVAFAAAKKDVRGDLVHGVAATI